ncbi:uncharacterized protein DS421_12g376160 [Arachis hypogaea]|nr:uncharacterized protein DS421_12g376160 [Arachis hypogaea]
MIRSKPDSKQFPLTCFHQINIHFSSWSEITEERERASSLSYSPKKQERED